MINNEFIYTSYIKTTPEKLWNALTSTEFTRQYWGDTASDWKKGSEWGLITGSGESRTVKVIGKILESTPPHRLVFSWAEPTDKTDESKVTFEIEALEDVVRLVVTHNDFKAGSTMPSKVSYGWPLVLSSMKSLLETGKAFSVMACKAPQKGAA